MILTELLVGMGALAVILVTAAPLWQAMQKVNDREMARQRCLAAAAAQLDSLGRTGQTIPPDQIDRLWPRVRVDVAREAGQGDWAGLTLLKAAAVTVSHGREVRAELARYVEGGR